MNKSLARDWGKDEIRVNNICPGYIKTSMTSKSYNNKREKKNRDKRIILRLWGSPKDLVGPVIFLLLNSSSYITGTDIIVDGGWIINGM